MDIKELGYVLLGFIQSGYLEQRFGWYRQLCGANYFNSVLQLLQAEKSIRIRSLLDMNFNMDSIKEIFRKQNARTDVDDPFIVRRNRWINRDNADEAISYYITGYIAKCIMKSTSCASCHKIVSDGKKLIQPLFETHTDIQEKIETKHEFVRDVTRGWLVRPSDAMNITTIHASGLFRYIIQNDNSEQILLKCSNPRSTFTKIFMVLLQNNEITLSLLNYKCEYDHIVKSSSRVVFAVFNTCSKNFISELNDHIHMCSKRNIKADPKQSPGSKKQKKLSSA